MRSFLWRLVWVLGVAAAIVAADDKPVVAVFPLGGSAPAELREKIGFSIRTKLDRDGHFEPIDGPTMSELVGNTTFSVDTSPSVLSVLVREQSPAAFIWGEVNGTEGSATMKVKTLDLRKPSATPKEFDRPIAQPTDIRFVVEEALSSLAGVEKFAQLSEQAANDDPAVGAAFESRPNLLPDGDFETSKPWMAILKLDRYPPPITGGPPETDRVAINAPTDPKGMNALGMTLSSEVAEGSGLACLSAAVPIAPRAHFRLQFEYKSDGPVQSVFVKGYVPTKNMAGDADEKQTYERQVPTGGATSDQWVKVKCDINPTISPQPPTSLRVDLYAFGHAGRIWFRDVQLKKIDLN